MGIIFSCAKQNVEPMVIEVKEEKKLKPILKKKITIYPQPIQAIEIKNIKVKKLRPKNMFYTTVKINNL